MMITQEILQIIESLIGNTEIDTKIETYSIEELEELALYLYNKDRQYPKNELTEMLDSILWERVHKIHTDFKWTEEIKAQFLKINHQFIETFEQAYQQALSIAADLEKRIANHDAFLMDYVIEIDLKPYIKDKNDYEELDRCFALVLCESLSSHTINHTISYGHSVKESPLYLDKTYNWNREYFGDTFQDQYIGYAIHALLDTDRWSFYDIINIVRIDTDLVVYYQNYRDIPN